MKKDWGILVHLGKGMWGEPKPYEKLDFNENVWNEIVSDCEKNGINSIILDLGEGVVYSSHPELANEGAWSREKIKGEVKKCREKGIALIPKLNFSATHDAWLREYGRMVSTPLYYKVCRDLILEVYELFEGPAYIHLGLDEEDEAHQKSQSVSVVRHGKHFLKDVQYLCDCVREAGATPMFWADPYWNDMEGFKSSISKDVVLNPWYYNAFRDEHRVRVDSRQVTIDWYKRPEYAGMNIEFVEDDPDWVRVRASFPPMVKDGYKLMPCVSTVNACEYNTQDMIEYFKNIASDEQIIGFITAPWVFTTEENLGVFKDSITKLKDARDIFYK